MEKMNGPVQLEDIAEVCSTCYESVRDGHDKCSHTKVLIITVALSICFTMMKTCQILVFPHIYRSGGWWVKVEKRKVFDLSQQMT